MSSEDKPLPNLDVIILSQPSHGQPPLVTSEQLFKDQSTLRIAHEGGFYLLRITREKKLILTK